MFGYFTEKPFEDRERVFRILRLGFHLDRGSRCHLEAVLSSDRGSMMIDGKMSEDPGRQRDEMSLIHDRIAFRIQFHPGVVEERGGLGASATV
jgi:hypothetical protein